MNVSISKRRTRLVRVAVAAAALTAAGLPLSATVADAATASPAVTFTGSAGALPAASATVVIEAELAFDINAKGVPQKLEDIPVAAQAVTSGAFSVPVPDSATLDQAESQGRGNVNFAIIVTSGDRATSQYVPAPITPAAAPGNTAAATFQADRVVTVPAFPAFTPAGGTAAQSSAPTSSNPAAQAAPLGIGPPPCIWTTYGAESQDHTRIGEAHVANVSGVSDTFHFKNQNDMTVSVGFSAKSPEGDYSSDGSIKLTNSLSASGGHTFGAGSVAYVNDTTNYQRYQGTSSCGGPIGSVVYKIQAVGTDSDVFPGTNTPPVNPWGGCTKDPLHATLAPHSTWSLDHSSALSYDTIANLFGYTFGGSDGFTTDVEHDYSSAGASKTTYICGDARGEDPTQAPVLYNTP